MEVCTVGNTIPTSVPYRATKLWNDVIIAFRSGMPLARHRRYMKTYEDCFSASESVDWLHEYLRCNPNFGSDVTRAQTIQLLQKLHRARVIEDVRRGKHNKADICDNGRLFRFTCTSPMKKQPGISRTPFTERTNTLTTQEDNQPLKPSLTNALQPNPFPPVEISNCVLVAKRLSQADVEETWKNVTLDRLQYILNLENLSDILDGSFVLGRNINHNCVFLNKSGIVTNIDPKDQLPHWAMSAMKCLAHWPDRVDDNLPNYPGFEKDVYRVVKDYFCGLPEPLMTYEMYEVIINVFVTAEGSQQHYDSHNDLNEDTTPESLHSFESVENLILNLTNVGTLNNSYDARSTPDNNQRVSRLTSSASALDLSPILPAPDSFVNRQMRRCESSINLPIAKYETAFGPENRTVTRVYYNDGVSTDYGYTNGPNEFSKTPLETHFDTDNNNCDNLLPISDGHHSSYDVHFAHVRSVRNKEFGHPSENNRRRSCGYLIGQNPLSYSSDMNSNRTHVTSSVGDCVTRRPCRRRSGSDCPINDRSRRHSSCDEVFYSDKQQSISAENISNTSCDKQEVVPPVRRSHHTSQVSPPHYSQLFPKGHQPVLDGATRLLRKCHRSKSSVSLHRTKSSSSLASSTASFHSERPMQQLPAECLYPEHCPPNMRNTESKESLRGRSLSLSDLMHAEMDTEKGTLRKPFSRSSLQEDVIEKKKRALQLVCLLLPPANRRKLHLLLKLMGRMSDNTQLCISEDQTTRSMLLETFHRSILSSQDEADMEDLLVMKIVSFLMDHSAEVMAVPCDLKIKVEEKLNTMNKAQIVYSHDDPSSLYYCQQVSVSQYEAERLSHSQRALMELLEEIITDRTMALKDKKKRLKQFQKTYPDIYAKRFPTPESENEIFPTKPKIKQPLLVRPLMKLKGLRI